MLRGGMWGVPPSRVTGNGELPIAVSGGRAAAGKFDDERIAVSVAPRSTRYYCDRLFAISSSRVICSAPV